MLELYKNIKRIREEKGMSQEELARLVGFKSRSSINKIEMGVNDITQSKLVAIANALGVSPGELMGSDDPASAPAPPAPQKSSSLSERDRTANGGPAHASAREMHQLEKILAEPNLTYNGVALGAEDIEKINRALELAFWDAKEKNKRKK